MKRNLMILGLIFSFFTVTVKAYGSCDVARISHLLNMDKDNIVKAKEKSFGNLSVCEIHFIDDNGIQAVFTSTDASYIIPDLVKDGHSVIRGIIASLNPLTKEEMAILKQYSAVTIGKGEDYFLVVSPACPYCRAALKFLEDNSDKLKARVNVVLLPNTQTKTVSIKLLCADKLSPSEITMNFTGKVCMKGRTGFNLTSAILQSKSIDGVPTLFRPNGKRTTKPVNKELFKELNLL